MPRTASRFWRENANRYNLMGGKCGNCGEVYFPPRSVCAKCHRASIGKMQPLRMKGGGEVLSYTIVHDAPEKFEMQVPYIMAIIRLDEGPRLTAQLIDCEPPAVSIGMRAKVAFRRLGEEGEEGVIYYGYKFAPA